MTKTIRVFTLALSELFLIVLGFLLWLIAGNGFVGMGLLLVFAINLLVGVILSFWIKKEVPQAIIFSVSAIGLLATGFSLGILILPRGFIVPWIRVCSIITLCLLPVFGNYMLRTEIKRFLSNPTEDIFPDEFYSLFDEKKRPHRLYTDEDALIDEVLYYLQEVKKLFVGEYPVFDDIIGMLFIIPVNSDHSYYRPDSDRLKISILVYESGWQLDNVSLAARINKSDFFDIFHLTQDSTSKYFVRYTAGNFHCDYKSFMSDLYDRINEVYPGRFTFSKGMIGSNDRYGTRMF